MRVTVPFELHRDPSAVLTMALIAIWSMLLKFPPFPFIYPNFYITVSWMVVCVSPNKREQYKGLTCFFLFNFMQSITILWYTTDYLCLIWNWWLEQTYPMLIWAVYVTWGVVDCRLNIYITYKGYRRFLTGCNGIYMNWQWLGCLYLVLVKFIWYLNISYSSKIITVP